MKDKEYKEIIKWAKAGVLTGEDYWRLKEEMEYRLKQRTYELKILEIKLNTRVSIQKK